jgi:dihydroorotate dehydrogenase (fumarate)
MELANPLVPSASPLSEDIDNLRHMEDAGASAVVLYSIFEEQLSQERLELLYHLEQGSESFPEAQSFFPESPNFHLGPEAYLRHIAKAKEALDIPVIASINGFSLGGWTDFAKKMEQAGADAIELNVYWLPTDMSTSGQEVEQTCVDILKAVKSGVRVPIAVKLSPYYSALGHLAAQLDDAGADALVLFNRFYQPDIDLELLEVTPNVLLSQPQALRLPLRWIAILHGQIKASLAATSGVHKATDVLKLLMAGADVTMMCAALLKHGIGHMTTVLADMRQWMEEHEYDSVSQMQGSMSHTHCEDPSAFERVQYMRALQSLPLHQV